MLNWALVIGAVVKALTTAIIKHLSKVKKVIYVPKNNDRIDDIHSTIGGMRAKDNKTSRSSDVDTRDIGKGESGSRSE